MNGLPPGVNTHSIRLRRRSIFHIIWVCSIPYAIEQRPTRIDIRTNLSFFGCKKYKPKKVDRIRTDRHRTENSEKSQKADKHRTDLFGKSRQRTDPGQGGLEI